MSGGMFEDYAAVLQPDACASCGKGSSPTDKVRRCTACRCVHYCNQTCQKTHWKSGHKRQCSALSQSLKRWEAIVETDLAVRADGTGMFITGFRLGRGEDGDPRAPDLALKLFEAAAETDSPIPGGHPIAMLCAGVHYERGIGAEEHDYEKALRYYKRVCEHPDPGESTKGAAYKRLARMFHEGLGTDKDENMARRCLEYAEMYKYASD